MCGMEGHINENRKTWTQSSRRKPNLKSSTALVSDFIQWIFFIIFRYTQSLYFNLKSVGRVIIIVWIVWMLSSSSVFWLFEGGTLLFLCNFFLLREFFVRSGDMPAQFPPIIKLLITDFAGVHISIDGFGEESYTFFF